MKFVQAHIGDQACPRKAEAAFKIRLRPKSRGCFKTRLRPKQWQALEAGKKWAGGAFLRMSKPVLEPIHCKVYRFTSLPKHTQKQRVTFR